MRKGMNNELEGLDTNYLRFSYLLLETRRNIFYLNRELHTTNHLLSTLAFPYGTRHIQTNKTLIYICDVINGGASAREASLVRKIDQAKNF